MGLGILSVFSSGVEDGNGKGQGTTEGTGGTERTGRKEQDGRVGCMGEGVDKFSTLQAAIELCRSAHVSEFPAISGCRLGAGRLCSRLDRRLGWSVWNGSGQTRCAAGQTAPA